MDVHRGFFEGQETSFIVGDAERGPFHRSRIVD